MKILADTFDHNPMVTAMNFSRNKLETLPAGVFRKLEKLFVIDMSYNRVQILSIEVGNCSDDDVYIEQ